MPGKKPNFLVIQLARLGDLVQTKRLVLSLEREGRVHLALDAALCPLAALVFPRASLHPLQAHAGERNPAKVLAVNAAAFAALSGLDFKAVYSLNRNPLGLALAGLFAPESVVGYRLDHGQACSSIWCKMAGRWSGAGRRLTSPLNLVDFWAHFHPAPLAGNLTNPPAAPRRAPGGQRLGVVLAGRESRRSLPPEYLARVLEALFAARKGPEILLLGSKTEQDAARRLTMFLNPKTAQKVRDLSGRTSLADLYEIISDLDLLVTPDTGPMHLAAHLGVPVAAFFLSSALVWETGPYGAGHQIWQALRPACSPCLETAVCPYKTACLAPFANPAWLAGLSGRSGAASGDDAGETRLLGLEPCFDQLGIDYRVFCGDLSAAKTEIRLQKRQIIAEYLSCGLPAGPLEIAESLRAELVHEADWMLPDY